MIQSISSSKIIKTNNYIDAKSKSATNISFKGLNTSKVGREIIGDTSSKIGKKIIESAEEIVGVVNRTFRKFKGKDELTYSEKPITCNMLTNDKLEAESKKRAIESAQVDSYRKDTIQKIKDSGNNPAPGDVDTYGHPTSQGQHKIDNPTRAHRQHEDFDNNSNDISFGSNSYDKVHEEMERIQKSPWLSNEEKSKELIKLSGHNLEAGDIDSHGHLTIMGQHKLENPTFRGNGQVDNISDEIDRIQNSPWLSEEEKAKEIKQIKHPTEQNVSTDDTLSTTGHHNHTVDDNAPSSDPTQEQHESFLKRFFDSFLGNGDDNIDT